MMSQQMGFKARFERVETVERSDSGNLFHAIVTNSSYFGCQLVQALVIPLQSIRSPVICLENNSSPKLNCDC